mgnify:CR=1 FL=1
MLVHDEDVDKVRGLLRPRPLSAKILGRRDLIRCDVYSVSGLRGSSYQGISYYPPHLAEGILERAVRHRSGAMVPSGRDHFYSLAFHALYHKGLRSGLPVSGPGLELLVGVEPTPRRLVQRGRILVLDHRVGARGGPARQDRDRTRRDASRP